MTAIERVVQFGSIASLSGILTEPDPAFARPDVSPVLLINSGILHKVGACRLYVRLARALAEAGIPSLRFDLSGLGDSDVRRDALPFEESAVSETREAMDFLTHSRGWTQFYLAGLCSGADVAHMTSLVDNRVAGMASIDARTNVTPLYWWHHYAPKLFTLPPWVRFVRRQLGRRVPVGSKSGPDESAFEVPQYVRVIPPHQELSAELKVIASRGIRMLYIFTDGLDNYNYEGQHRSAFPEVPFGESMVECHLRGSDHIITDLQMQQKAIDIHVQWILANQVSSRLSARAVAPALP